MAKRKNGEGTYGSKMIKGIEYKYYRFPDGHYVYAKKPKELEEKKKAYISKKTDRTTSITKESNLYTFDDYCLYWLKQHHSVITPRVYDGYESVINSRIKPYSIGSMQIKSLTVNAFNIYFNELSQKYSKASIDKVWTIIRQVLTYGAEEGDLPPLTLSKIHRPNETVVVNKKKDIPFISLDDMDKLYNEVYNSKRYGMGSYVIVFIMYSGLRISEAIGLKWKYVSKDFSTIKIEQTAAKIVERDKDLNPIIKNGKQSYILIQKGTKSIDSQRIIPMSDQCKEILKMFYNKAPHNPDDFVFTSSATTPFGTRALERTLTSILKHSDCSRKDYTPHCLRHGFGSVLIQQGVDIKVVSELLGHSDVAFTYNTYIGVSHDDKSKAINVFNKKRGNS